MWGDFSVKIDKTLQGQIHPCNVGELLRAAPRIKVG